MDRKMCHDCPYRNKPEGTVVIVTALDYTDVVYTDTPHPCHNALHLDCVGHKNQLEKHGPLVYQHNQSPLYDSQGNWLGDQ